MNNDEIINNNKWTTIEDLINKKDGEVPPILGNISKNILSTIKDLSMKVINFLLMVKDVYNTNNFKALLQSQQKEDVFIVYTITNGVLENLFVKNIVNQKVVKM